MVQITGRSICDLIRVILSTVCLVIIKNKDILTVTVETSLSCKNRLIRLQISKQMTRTGLPGSCCIISHVSLATRPHQRSPLVEDYSCVLLNVNHFLVYLWLLLAYSSPDKTTKKIVSVCVRLAQSLHFILIVQTERNTKTQKTPSTNTTYRVLRRSLYLDPLHRRTFHLQKSVEKIREALKVFPGDLKNTRTLFEPLFCLDLSPNSLVQIMWKKNVVIASQSGPIIYQLSLTEGSRINFQKKKKKSIFKNSDTLLRFFAIIDPTADFNHTVRKNLTPILLLVSYFIFLLLY